MAAQYLKLVLSNFSNRYEFLEDKKHCAVESNKIIFFPSYLLKKVWLFKETVIIVLLVLTFSRRTL